jgi:hypothetical protein
MSNSNLGNIFKDGFLVDVDVSFWSASKKLTEEDMGLDNVSAAYTLGKKYLIPREVMQAFRRIESRARALVENSSFKFPIGNARFIPKKKFIKINEELKKHQSEYDALVEDLISKYQDYRENMKPVYLEAAEKAYMNKSPDTMTFGLDHDPEAEKKAFVDQFMARIDACYPPVESLRSKFSLQWAVFEIALPRIREGDADMIAEDQAIRQKIEEDYQNQMHAKIGTFVNDVVGVLRQETIELCNHITSNITEGKVIKSTTIQSLTNFIDKFRDMNFVGDKTIEDSLNSIRKELIDVHPTSAFTDNAELQTELKRRLNLVAQQASSMTDINSITGEYRRKINWE